MEKKRKKIEIDVDFLEETQDYLFELLQKKIFNLPKETPRTKRLREIISKIEKMTIDNKAGNDDELY